MMNHTTMADGSAAPGSHAHDIFLRDTYEERAEAYEQIIDDLLVNLRGRGCTDRLPSLLAGHRSLDVETHAEILQRNIDDRTGVDYHEPVIPPETFVLRYVTSDATHEAVAFGTLAEALDALIALDDDDETEDGSRWSIHNHRGEILNGRIGDGQ